MALDLKTEVFAYHVFYTFWIADGVIQTAPRIREIYGEESLKKINFEEVCDKVYISAICMRHLIFKKLYGAVITNEKAKGLKSLLDCYEYINCTCDRQDLFGHLTFFPRMFATLTFVLFFCFQVRNISQDIDLVNYGHMLWAMYFDKFTDEFYEKGGWDRLRIESYFYVYIVPFGVQFDVDDINLREVREAIVNFCRFTDAIHNQNHPRLLHISRPWIKFRIEHFDSYVKIPLSYELALNTYEAELLLENLMAIFDPSRCTTDNRNIPQKECKICDLYARTSSLKQNCSSKNMKINVDTKFQPLTVEQEKRFINTVSSEFSNIDSDFENQAGANHSSSNEEGILLDITNKYQYLEFDLNTLKKAELPKQTSPEYTTKNLHIKRNSLPVINRTQQSGTIIRNSLNASDSDSCWRSSFVNKDEFGKTDNFCKDNREKQDKMANTAQVVSMNKIQEKASPESVSTLKVLLPENENTTNNDKSKMIRTAKEDLRNEREDSEIKNFLKMLLVLNVKKETKIILSMLRNNEECFKIPQENTDKQKKKSKKKKNKK